MFKKQFKFDNNEFNSKSSLALYLRNNFRKSLKIVEDGSLLNFISEEYPDLATKIIVKNFNELIEKNMVMQADYPLHHLMPFKKIERLKRDVETLKVHRTNKSKKNISQTEPKRIPHIFKDFTELSRVTKKKNKK